MKWAFGTTLSVYLNEPRRGADGKNRKFIMKKLSLCVLLAFGAVCVASAQDKAVSLGLRAGLNINSLFYSGSGEAAIRDALSSRAGYHVGVVVDCKAARNFYIQPGFYFTTRGARLEETGTETIEGYSCKYSLTAKFGMNYLQIPVSLSYRFPIGRIVKIDVNAGPYFAAGLGGREKAEATVSYNGEKVSASESCDIFGKSTADETRGDFKRFDAGLRFGTGVHIRKFSVGLIYDLGLANLLYTGEEHAWDKGMKLRNGSFQVSAGYNF